MSIAREGWIYIGVFLVAGVLCLALEFPALGIALLALGLFSSFFFRDPERTIPQDPHLVLSPADGRVLQVLPAPAGNPLGEGATQASIFLSIFDVHINRAPIGGRVAAFAYHPGAFLPAWDDKASLSNEQTAITIEDATGRVAFKQIAGLIARRIVFKKRVDELVSAGERVGLIKFGSRVDVFVPQGVSLRIKPGDRVRGGSSVIAERPRS